MHFLFTIVYRWRQGIAMNRTILRSLILTNKKHYPTLKEMYKNDHALLLVSILKIQTRAVS